MYKAIASSLDAMNSLWIQYSVNTNHSTTNYSRHKKSHAGLGMQLSKVDSLSRMPEALDIIPSTTKQQNKIKILMQISKHYCSLKCPAPLFGLLPLPNAPTFSQTSYSQWAHIYHLTHSSNITSLKWNAIWFSWWSTSSLFPFKPFGASMHIEWLILSCGIVAIIQKHKSSSKLQLLKGRASVFLTFTKQNLAKCPVHSSHSVSIC